jgi:hypothetical protein
MRPRQLQTGLLLALSLLVTGCAQIIGADFDKPFQSSGAGGAGGGSATASTSSTGGAAVTAGSTGGGGGAGGGCELGGALLTDTISLHVWAKDVLSSNQGAEDFFTSSPTILVPSGSQFPNAVETYKLFSAPDPGNRVLLYQCVSEGHHVTTKPVGTCECLGYAVQILGTSSPNKDDYAPLTQILGRLPESNALIPAMDESTEGNAMCMAYGNTTVNPAGCTAIDMLYGAK